MKKFYNLGAWLQDEVKLGELSVKTVQPEFEPTTIRRLSAP